MPVLSTRAPNRPADLRLTLTADHAHGSRLRALLCTWCAGNGVGGDESGDALLVSSELFSNAVAAADVGSSVFISASLRSDAMVLSVSNSGQPFELESVSLSSIDRLGGRGLMIVQAVGVVSVSHHGGMTTVSAALPIRAQPMR